MAKNKSVATLASVLATVEQALDDAKANAHLALDAYDRAKKKCDTARDDLDNAVKAAAGEVRTRSRGGFDNERAHHL